MRIAIIGAGIMGKLTTNEWNNNLLNVIFNLNVVLIRSDNSCKAFGAISRYSNFNFY